MTRSSTLLTSAALGFSVLALSGTALADVVIVHEHDHHEHLATLGAQFQYGIWTGDGNTNAYGPGVGIRGGFTLDPGLYLGANFDYFAGEKNSSALGSGRFNVYDISGEIGYDFWVHPHGILRPKLGLGLGVAHVEVCGGVAGIGGGCASRSENGIAIAPGVQYLHFFSALYLSLEARYQTISIDGSDPSALVLGVGLGAAF